MSTATDTQRCPTPRASNSKSGDRLKLGYIVGRFPRPNETFVLTELEALRANDVSVEVFPLLDLKHAAAHNSSSLRVKAIELLRPTERPDTKHEAAARWKSRAFYSPLLSMEVLLAQFSFFFAHPVRYLTALCSLLFRSFGQLRFLSSGLMLFPRIVLMARQMERMRVTHVHAHFANEPAAAALVVHQLTGLPFSFTPHGTDLHHDRHMLKQKIRQAAFVVCISKFNRDRLLEAGGFDCVSRLKVVHCGINTHLFSPREEPITTTQPIRVLLVGSLLEVKGQAILLQACAELKRRGERIECHIVGTGPDRNMLGRLAAHFRIADQVFFHGYLTPKEIHRELQCADVLVCPSVESSDGRREGIPVVLMEAMATGVPVIASSLSGIPELVTNEVEGLLLEPGNADELANGIQFLAENPSTAQAFADAALSKILAEFDIARTIPELIHLFRTGGESQPDVTIRGSNSQSPVPDRRELVP